MTAVLTMAEGCIPTTDWQAIVHQYGPIVWRTVYRLLPHEADAADCFQETFVSALDFSRRQAVENWPGLLQRLATARALDQLRKRMREAKGRRHPAEWDEVPSRAADPVQQVEATELTERLRLALTELPKQQSEVFCLRYLNDLSYDEIATALGTSIDAVGVALHRARGKLRELLGTQCTDVRVR